ncbi:META domain-containing protein [Streptomyces avermitilis]|uniref:META domain-containing protein n=1 Tax=Streptomyces avermitilis TaxID=33903 RepID=UPI0037117B83
MYRQRLTLPALTLTALTLLPLAVACGNEKGGGTGSSSVGADTEPSVTGVDWTVDSVTVNGTTHQAPDGAHVEIAKDGRATGNYGCNSFHSTATFKGDRITLSRTLSTEMACEKRPMEFEASLARALAAGPLTAEAGQGKLTLTTTEGDRVHLTEEKDAPLYGTKWTVNSLVGGDVAQSLPAAADGKAWLTFTKKSGDKEAGGKEAGDKEAGDKKGANKKGADKETGTVSGSLGCNRVSAKATVRGSHITLGAPRTTRQMCSGSLMTAEKSLLKLFDSTVSYRIDHRSITLTSENGEGIGAMADR